MYLLFSPGVYDIKDHLFYPLNPKCSVLSYIFLYDEIISKYWLNYMCLGELNSPVMESFLTEGRELVVRELLPN